MDRRPSGELHYIFAAYQLRKSGLMLISIVRLSCLRMYLSLVTGHICPIPSNPPSGEDTQGRIIGGDTISIILNILH